MIFAEEDRNQIQEHYFEPRACRALWCRVIEEQINLIVSPKKTDLRAEIFAARRWFGSGHFFTACALAGVDGELVLRGVQRHLALQGLA